MEELPKVSFLYEDSGGNSSTSSEEFPSLSQIGTTLSREMACASSALAGEWDFSLWGGEPLAGFPNCSIGAEPSVRRWSLRLDLNAQAAIVGHPDGLQALRMRTTVQSDSSQPTLVDGRWTAVYDKGLALSLGEWSFFGQLEPGCGATLPGEYHSQQGEWGCFSATLTRPSPSRCADGSCSTSTSSRKLEIHRSALIPSEAELNTAPATHDKAAASAEVEGTGDVADLQGSEALHRELTAAVNSANTTWTASSNDFHASAFARIVSSLHLPAQAATTAPVMPSPPPPSPPPQPTGQPRTGHTQGGRARVRQPVGPSGPAPIDWRTHRGGGWLSPVPTAPIECQSCAAAAAALAMVESRIRIASNRTQSDILSLVDALACSPYARYHSPYLVGAYGVAFGTRLGDRTGGPLGSNWDRTGIELGSN